MMQLDYIAALPEIILALYGMVALLAVVYTGKDTLTTALTWVTVAVLVGMAFWVGTRPGAGAIAFSGAFHDDAFARFAKVTVLLAAAAVLAMSEDYMRRQGLARFEYPILIVFAVVGMMMMVSSGDLMALYMGLELMSLALYVVAALRRDSLKSTEAGLKYFVLGALSSGMLLYGASLIYGFAGTTVFKGIIATVHQGEMSVGLLFGLVFLMTGLAFKVSAVPFHMWTPDVYEGSPTPVTAFFATAPKVAAMALFARVMHDAFGTAPGDWGQIIAVMAVLSMFLGAVAAIGQRDIKRLMAYSSIAHMGFALTGLAAGTAQGVQAMLIYMAIYAAMNVGTFAFILGMEKNGQPVTDIETLNMYSKSSPVNAAALLILMFSLAGVPPMLGFFAKFGVLRAAVDAGMTWLALAGAVASVIGAYYYLRIVFYMYFGTEKVGLSAKMPVLPWLFLIASAIIMIVGIGNLFGIEGAAQAAADVLVN
jgi:NADH-quinone oxidoreductase subunit N